MTLRTMKKTMGITHIGLCYLTTIPVKSSFFGLVLIASLLQFACNASYHSWHTNETGNYDYRNHCDTDHCKPFVSHAIHLEVEPTGEMSQVFYNIDPLRLNSQPIVLNKVIHLTGSALGAE